MFRSGRTLRVRCRRLFKVSLYRSEWIVVPFSKKTAAGLVFDLCSITLKMSAPTPHCTHINGMLPIHAVQEPVNFYGTNLFGGKNSITTLSYVYL
jgi:hypothetical protein